MTTYKGFLASRLRKAIVYGSAAALLVSAPWLYRILVEPQPAVAVRVGIRHAPPYSIARPDRPFAGLGVDVIEQAARRLRLPIQWVVITDPAPDALRNGQIDIWPVMNYLPERTGSLHLTEPWMQSNYFLLSREDSGIERNSDVAGRRVAFVGSTLETRLANQLLSAARLLPTGSAAEAMGQLCSGAADAAFVEARSGQALLMKRPGGCENLALRFALVDGATLPLCVGSTLAAASVADSLRAEIGRLADDGLLDSIISRWSFVTTKETQTVYSMIEARRRTRLSVYGMLLLGLALLVSVWQIHRVRQAQRAAEEASAALKVSEERYRSLVENASDIVLTHDLDGRITSLNRAGERLTGYSREEARALNMEQLLAPEHLPVFRAALQRYSTREAPATYDVEIVTKSGGRRALEISASPVLRAGRLQAFQAIARDVTERRQLEEELHQAHKMEAVGKLAGGVAHDFNNLLTVILGYADLLQSQTDPACSEGRMVAEIRNAAEQAAALTAQLLAFGRRQRLEPRVLDLNATVSSTQTLLQRVIGEHVELRTVLAADLGWVKADPGQIQQVILNLAANARDAMTRGGVLTLQTANESVDTKEVRGEEVIEPGQYVVLTITDTGEGMDKATLVRVFEPFFTTKELGKGTGLGLSTVYGIVKQSGGGVRIESEPGRGTAFTIWLPRVEQPPEPTVVRPVEKRAANDATVLLVEDEDYIRDMVRISLQRSGFRVIEARDGVDALRKVGAQGVHIDVLLTDVVMPRMTGPDLARELRKTHPDLRILFVSGYTDAEFLDASEPLSSAGFLQKPFTAAVLNAKLLEVLHQA